MARDKPNAGRSTDKITTENNIRKSEIDKTSKPFDELDLRASFTDIQSRIRKEITPDFTKAKLSENQKESIIELTSSAYFCKQLIENLRDLSKWYDWKEKKWKKYTETEKPTEYKLMSRRAEYVFEMVMNRPFMMAILNRNVKDNYILKLQAGVQEPEETEEEVEERKANTVAEKLKAVLRPNKKEETL